MSEMGNCREHIPGSQRDPRREPQGVQKLNIWKKVLHNTKPMLQFFAIFSVFSIYGPGTANPVTEKNFFSWKPKLYI